MINFSKTAVSSIEIISKISGVYFNYVLCFILVVPYVLSIPLWEARPESVLRQPSSLLVRPIKRKRTNMTSSS